MPAMQQMHIYLTRELKAAYEKRAKARRPPTSASAEIRMVLEQDVERDSKKKAA